MLCTQLCGKLSGIGPGVPVRSSESGHGLKAQAGVLFKTSTGHTPHISGDTAYFDRFSEIGRESGIDLDIFNLGAYEPRWFMKKPHINPEEAFGAFREPGPENSWWFTGGRSAWGTNRCTSRMKQSWTS